MISELSPEQIDSICLSYRHDFGLDKPDFGPTISAGMTENERNILRFQIKEIYHAIRKELSPVDLLKNISTVELTNELSRRNSIAHIKAKMTKHFINISFQNLSRIPEESVWIKQVAEFSCDDNFLTSLIGSPEKIIDESAVYGDFYCDSNFLTSLYGCSKIVSSYFSYSNNRLFSSDSLPLYCKGFGDGRL